METVLASMKKAQEEQLKATQADKVALIKELAEQGVTQVTIHFDGYDDNGTIEDVVLRQGEANGERKLGLGDGLRERLEEFAYGALEATYPGWEINEGSFGDVIIEVATATVRVEHAQRVEDVHHSTTEV